MLTRALRAAPRMGVMRVPARMSLGAGEAPVGGLSWSSVSGATGYKVYHGTSPGAYIQAYGAGVDVGNVLAYSPGWSSGTYYVAVTAIVGGEETAWSVETTYTI